MKLRNPFPGIRPFAEDEGEFFFGRDHQISQLLTKLSLGSFVAVVGTSGCGKSSLVRAGLIPRLMKDNWLVTIFRPQNPLEDLRLALESIPFEFGDEETREEFKEIWMEMISDNLLSSSDGIVETFKQSGSQRKLIIVIDQFEELFAYQKDSNINRENAIRFINLLLHAVHQKEFPIHVLLTLRSDQLGRCSEFKGLPEIINDGLFLVPRLSREQYREAIVRPLLVQNIKIGSNLVSQLLNDIEDDPDQLPVLQHSLMVTFDGWIEKASGPDLSIEMHDYLAAGGMAQSIDAQCNKIFQKLKDRNLALPTEIIFQRLTEVNLVGVETRSPARLDTLVQLAGVDRQDVIEILDAFRKDGCNFLMPPLDVPLDNDTLDDTLDDPLIDLSHESIMRKWGMLRTWIRKEEENKRFLQRLLEHFRNYTLGERGPLKNPTLAAYRSWEKYQQRDKSRVLNWAARYSDRFKEAAGFVKASIRWDNNRKKIRLLLLIALPIVLAVATLLIAEKMHDAEHRAELEYNQLQLDSLNTRKREKQAELLLLDAEIAKDSLGLQRSITRELNLKMDSLNTVLKNNSVTINALISIRDNNEIKIEGLEQKNSALNNDLSATARRVNNDSVRSDQFIRELYLAELKNNQVLLAAFETKVKAAQKSRKIDDQSAQLLTRYIRELKKIVEIPVPESPVNTSDQFTFDIYTYTLHGKQAADQFIAAMKEKGQTGKFNHHPINNKSFFPKSNTIWLVGYEKDENQLSQMKASIGLSDYKKYQIKRTKKWQTYQPEWGRSIIIVLDF